MTHTMRTTPSRAAVARELTVSSFDRVRPGAIAPRRRRAPRRAVGAVPVRDPRGDLKMFELTPRVSPAPARPRADVEELAPLLPPVISDPPRVRVRRPAGSRAAASVAAPREVPAEPAAPRRRSVRLTLRGYAALLGLGVAVIAATSAMSVAGEQAAPAVPTTEVVARPGESIEQVAARAADGRDVGAVAASIRAANGLATGTTIHAGDVLVVPGS